MLLRYSHRLAGGCAAAVGIGIGATARWLTDDSGSSSNEQLGGDFQRKPPLRVLRHSKTGTPLDAKPAVTGQPVLVGIAGGTGSGKTTVAQAISNRLNAHGDKVCFISHDSYYKALEHLSIEERAQYNFDHPDSLDTNLMVEHLRALKEGKSVRIPVYDFATHSRIDGQEEKAPSRVILVEGILIYAHPDLRELLDIKIFVDTDSDVRFIRRLKRDISERGRDYAAVISQYMRTVRPMHTQFVEPSKSYADVIIPTGLNSVALEMVIARLEQVLNHD